MKAYIKAVEYFLPEEVLDNQQLAAQFPDWPANKIESKTGIRRRHIASGEQCTSDLAVAAARRLFASGVCTAAEVDFLILCTQSPDFFLPTTACLVQHQLGLPTSCGALDFNLGCSGYIYGLSLAKGIVESGQTRNVLLVTAETYSKFIHPGDKSVRTIFGDAAAATLVCGREAEQDLLGPFVFGTDGSGAHHLIVPTGGLRKPKQADAPLLQDESGNQRTENHLFMNGPEIFDFSSRAIPPAVQELLARSGLTREDIDLWVMHQANRFILEHLRKKMGIAEDRFALALAECGNTVSSTIPIALRDMLGQGRLKPAMKVALVGWGVGYSWGATLARWT